MSANTLRSYRPKQQEWIRWCQAQANFTDPKELVNAEKLDLFLRECVLSRAPSPRGYNGRNQRRQAENPGELAWTTASLYVDAMKSLYEDQVIAGINPFPNPRPAIKGLLKAHKAKTAERNKKSFKDRGLGTMLDQLHPNDLVNISRWFLDKSFKLNSLRDRAMFLLCHSGLLRGEDARGLELADLSSYRLQAHPLALIMLMEHGKTNREADKQFAASFRHRDPLMCPIGALGIYLAYLWEKSPPPDITHRKKWFDIKVFQDQKAKNQTTELTYSTHYNPIKKCFDSLNIQSSAKTHIGRKSGAMAAKAGDVAGDSLRVAGQWQLDVVLRHYLTPLAIDCMYVLSGFDKNGKNYFLPREGIDPPDALQKKIFPFLEDYYGCQTGTSLCPHNVSCDRTFAGAGFVELLVWLRKVILQDACLIDFHHLLPVFSQPDFISYKRTLLSSLDSSPQPTPQEQLSRLIPSVIEALSIHSEQLLAAVRTSVVSTVQNSLNQSLNAISWELNPRLNVSLASPSVSSFSNLSVPSFLSSSPNSAFSSASSSSSSSSSSHTTMANLNRDVTTIVGFWTDWTRRESIIRNQETPPTLSSSERQFVNRRKRLAQFISSQANPLEFCSKLDKFRESSRKTLRWCVDHVDELPTDVRHIN